LGFQPLGSFEDQFYTSANQTGDHYSGFLAIKVLNAMNPNSPLSARRRASFLETVSQRGVDAV
jgi:hypothetical protein